MRPKIGQTVCDPACGTSGLLLAAYECLKGRTNDREALRRLRQDAFTGIEIVDEVVSLCAMNLYLQGIDNGGSPVTQGDALAKDPGKRCDLMLTNPPFGKKSSFKVIGEEGQVSTEQEVYEREDYRFSTSNKQLNFLQHVMTLLKTDGRAAEGARKRLLDQFDFHTLLRLPTGIFYRPGVKANVLFFDKKPASKVHWINELWVSSSATSSISTSSGSRTTVWRTWTASHHPTSSPRKSSTTSRPPWTSSPAWRKNSPKAEPS